MVCLEKFRRLLKSFSSRSFHDYRFSNGNFDWVFNVAMNELAVLQIPRTSNAKRQYNDVEVQLQQYNVSSKFEMHSFSLILACKCPESPHYSASRVEVEAGH